MGQRTLKRVDSAKTDLSPHGFIGMALGDKESFVEGASSSSGNESEDEVDENKAVKYR